MRGDLYDGWLTLAGASREGQFPPTLNTEKDPAQLLPHESPSCYGVDCQSDGRLKAGSILTGTARNAPTKSVGGNTYNWYFDRVWRASSAQLIYGAPAYDDAYFAQRGTTGKLVANANIVTFMPALDDQMWVVTGSGSHFVPNVRDPRGFFEIGKFVQEMWTPTATKAITLGGVPFVCNTDGVFSYDGRQVKEWTRPVRDSLGSFSNVAILADYEKRFIIGTAKFVIDTEGEKLFDYGTSGFRFTTRTLAVSRFYNPFSISRVAFLLAHTTGTDKTLKWQTQVEDGSWTTEADVECLYRDGQHSRVETSMQTEQSAHKFALRITSLPAGLEIREIQVLVGSYALGSIAL